MTKSYCKVFFLKTCRYNVDCAASEGFYGLAEGAFGSGSSGNGGDGGGECPAANPLSDAECGGAVSNCWSPGQPDTDCPDYGLCCFDGCANTCVDGAPPPQIRKQNSTIYYLLFNYI